MEPDTGSTPQCAKHSVKYAENVSVSSGKLLCKYDRIYDISFVPCERTTLLTVAGPTVHENDSEAGFFRRPLFSPTCPSILHWNGGLYPHLSLNTYVTAVNIDSNPNWLIYLALVWLSDMENASVLRKCAQGKALQMIPGSSRRNQWQGREWIRWLRRTDADPCW